MMRKMTPKTDENGLVAIIIATVIMVIMSLVTLGFARVMQREQRQALDKSLSTQAFYAAESGINDAIAAVHATPTLADKTTCDATVAPFNGTIDTANNANYSCLLISQKVQTLEYTQKSIKTSDSTIVPIKGANDEDISKLTVSWGDDSIASPGFKTCTTLNLPPRGNLASQWGKTSPGILKLDVVPVGNNGAASRAGLISNAMTVYLYPGDGCGTSSIDYASYIGTNAGQLVAVSCTAGAKPHSCTVDITGLGGKYYYLRMRSIYDASDLSISMFSATAQLFIKGAQVKIDSTGKVADIIRRVQVRAPVNQAYEIPDDALETGGSVCKLLSVVPAVGGNPASATAAAACPID